MKPTLVFLAAGMWSRYWGLKQIDPIGPNGEVIIDYSLYDAIEAGFGKVVFIIRKSIEADFKTFVGKRFEAILPVEYVYQELDILPEWFSVPEWRQKPWWTAHALLMAKEVVDTPFAVLNADDFYGRDAFVKMAEFLSVNTDDSLYAMMWYYLKNTVSDFGWVNRWICKVDNWFLDDIVETKNIHTKDWIMWYEQHDQRNVLSPEVLVSMNFFGFMPSIFDHIQQGFTSIFGKSW
jgi:UTP-glucose-1-phosphate uridylyltransferase